MKIGSMFSGVGGLDIAAEAHFGGKVAWYCENMPAASKVLATRFPGVENLGDVTQIDWRNVAQVDVLCAGFPCKDVSEAGGRAGIGPNTRSGLWTYVAQAIDVLRPQFVVIENVRGLLYAEAYRGVECETSTLGASGQRPVLRAAGAVFGALASTGCYEAAWELVSAAEVGAPHRRDRVFVLAARTDIIIEHPLPASRIERCDIERKYLSTPQARDSKGVPKEGYNESCLARDVIECENSWGDYEKAVAVWEGITRPAPAPAIPGVSGLRRPRINPAFSEWMMGLPAGWITDVDKLSRKEVLTIIGNSVVPRQAEFALSELTKLLTDDVQSVDL